MMMALGIIFPGRCELCGKTVRAGLDSLAVCESCRRDLVPLSGRRCARCGLPLISERELCMQCRERPASYEMHRSLFLYEGAAMQLVNRYKFQGQTGLAVFFAPLLAALCAAFPSAGVLCPVPSHPWNRRRRGYSPAALLARRMARLTGMHVRPLLARRLSRQQKSLGFDARLANVSGRFRVRGAAAGRVVLIDDVFTTGATVEECSRVLRLAGAGEIVAFTLAMEE